MRTSLGISAGNEVVCSAVVATAPNGAQSFDYRVVSADVAHSDPGDLVASSIELMTTQMPRDYLHRVGTHSPGASAPQTQPVPAGAIAVAYRDREQAMAIRAAIGRQRRDVQLIPESTAALTYLRDTGLLDRYETVAVIDLGASGTTVTVADLADDTVLRSERTEAISGSAVDELIYHHLLDCHFARRGTRPNRNMLINRSRAAKEHLSIAPAVTIDHVAGQPLKLTRADFAELIADLLHEAADYARAVFARAPKVPEAVAIIGGGANIASLVEGLDALLDIPVVSVPEPEAVTAKGAALVADSAQPSTFSPIALGSDGSAGTFTKVIGTLVGAVVVVGLVVGYGVKELVPTAHQDVTPAGTTDTQLTTTPAPTPTPAGTPTDGTGQSRTEHPPASSTQPGSSAPGTSPGSSLPTTNADQVPPVTPTTSAPVLRPDPNLPQIPLPPNLPHLLGPLLGTTTPQPVTPDTSTPNTPTPGAAPTKPGNTRVPVLPRSSSGSADSDPAQPTEPGDPVPSGRSAAPGTTTVQPQD
ncbi:Hsp70 family protein [Nocardia sp. MDA0666]|uniref:Hsp70 family protein n=1 Tax=Nocardia sp. MDA0666 TaxID=2135448 RepID=UPI000D13CFF7|nr:Hsp70 family protein [Nocardia sp. MDA0666]